MFKLSKNWLTEGIVDIEYKQYLLMAYLRDIHDVFEHKILYPPFTELVEHHQNLVSIQYNLQNIKHFRQTLKGIDWKNMKLIYGDTEEDNIQHNPTEFDIIEEVIDFSIPKIEEEIQHGKNVFDEVESHLKYTTVGLSPINKNYGYMFIQNYPTPEFSIYRYEVSSLYVEIDNQNIAFKGLNTSYITTYSLSVSNSLTSIKQEIIKQMPDLPNPAVYSFFPKITASMEYTILPIAKRILLKIIS